MSASTDLPGTPLHPPQQGPPRGPAVPQRPRRRPWRTVGLTLALLLVAGVLVAAIAGYQDAVDFYRRNDHLVRPVTSEDAQGRALEGGLATAPSDPAVAAELEEVLGQHLASGEFVGGRIALLGPDGAVTEVTEGAATVGPAADPVDLDEPWNVGSATKTFVAVVVLQLAEEGRLDLDEGIARWFPDLPQADRITPRMLLQHTSGLNEYIEDAAVQSDKARRWAPSELIAVAEAAGRLGEPGRAHRYTNTNYLVLGELIREVTGNVWDDEVRTRITEPLGMDHTHVARSVDEVPVGYAVVDGAFVDATRSADPSIGGAAGALLSTGRDLLEFGAALEQGELVSPEMLREMESFVPAEDLSAYGVEHTYGLGVERYRNDRITVIGHLGVGEAQTAYLGYDRAGGRVIAVQLNTAISGPAAVIALESLLAVADLH